MARLAERRKDLMASVMKDGIYEAAVAVLTRHGLEGMTMDRVADEAGIAKGSVYNYFPSKLDLLQFVHERALEPINRMIEEEMNAGRPAIRTIAWCIRRWFVYLDEHRGLFWFLFNDYAIRGLLRDREEASRESAVRNLTTTMERGIEEGALRMVDAAWAARFLFGAMRETTEWHLASGDPLRVNELTEGLMDIFLRGVRPESPGQSD